MIGKVVRYVAIAGVAGLFVALMIFNAPKNKTTAEKIWDERTTVGSVEAKNHFVMYTDLACPFCDVFSRQIMEHEEEFRREYVEKESVLLEIRLTDFLFEFGEHKPKMSRQSAEAAYCAAEEGRFIDYYYAAIGRLWDDYHSKGIGTTKGGPEIGELPDGYWVEIGTDLGLSAEFESCVLEYKMTDHVKEVTARAAQEVQGGLPYFVFNKFTTSGFDQSWGWDYVKQYLQAGLSTRTNS